MDHSSYQSSQASVPQSCRHPATRCSLRIAAQAIIVIGATCASELLDRPMSHLLSDFLQKMKSRQRTVLLFSRSPSLTH